MHIPFVLCERHVHCFASAYLKKTVRVENLAIASLWVQDNIPVTV